MCSLVFRDCFRDTCSDGSLAASVSAEDQDVACAAGLVSLLAFSLLDRACDLLFQRTDSDESAEQVFLILFQHRAGAVDLRLFCALWNLYSILDSAGACEVLCQHIVSHLQRSGLLCFCCRGDIFVCRSLRRTFCFFSPCSLCISCLSSFLCISCRLRRTLCSFCRKLDDVYVRCDILCGFFCCSGSLLSIRLSRITSRNRSLCFCSRLFSLCCDICSRSYLCLCHLCRTLCCLCCVPCCYLSFRRYRACSAISKESFVQLADLINRKLLRLRSCDLFSEFYMADLREVCKYVRSFLNARSFLNCFSYSFSCCLLSF